MRTILQYFSFHPTASNLLMFSFLLLGVLAAPELRRETLPDFAPKEIAITVVYPGATAEDVEESVCERIEEALESLSDVEEIVAEAQEGHALVVAEMVDGGDIDRFLMDVKTEVEAIDDFPDEVEDPVVKQQGRLDFVMSLAVSGPMSAPDLKAYCEYIKDKIVAHTAVSQVTVAGFSDRQIRVEIPAKALMQYGLSATEISDTISRQSVDLPGGTVQTKNGDLLIRFTDQRRTIQEFEDLVVVSGESGAEVRLGDIATITDRFELDEGKVIFNGRRAGILQVNKTEQQDALELVEQVDALLALERKIAPPTVDFTVTRNVSKIVKDRLMMLSENGLEGLLLVFLTMWLFFTFRYSFWVSMGLPVSFLGALYGMQLSGMTINMITMVGLLLAVGLIMDDAIVISENVASHIARGEKAKDAVVNGTSEVAVGILSSFATTVCIFGSLAIFLEGQIGKVLWVMPVVLILTLGVSLVEAFLILPHHLAHSLGKAKQKHASRFRLWFDARVEDVRGEVGRIADVAITWRYLLAGAVIALLLVSIGMVASGRLAIKVFPDLEGDIIEARVLLPQGTPLSRTEFIAARLVETLHQVDKEFSPDQPDGQKLVENVAVYFNTHADANENGPHIATVTVDLLDAELRNTRLDDVASRWRELVGEVPDVLSIVWKEPVLGPGGAAVAMRFQGADLEVLKKVSLELQEWLAQYTGVVDIIDDLRPGKPELRATLKAGATALGIDAGMVAQQLRTAFFGKTAAELQYRGESYEVDVRLAPEDKDSLADLAYFHVTDKYGHQIPVGELVSIKEGRGWARIARVNGMRTVTVEADVDSEVTNAAQIRADTMRRFIPALLKKYPGVTLSQQGEAKEGGKTGASLRKAFIVGIFGVFVLLSFQFGSYAEPFAVLMAVPLAFIGVIWGHLFMGLDLTMPSIMGFVSLAGIVVNDSILLMTFIKIRQQDGIDTMHAATQASRDRFRAVLLTSATTVMGLTPLLFETSIQAQILIPLACSIIFGLITSTLLVLFVVPSFYTILDDLGFTASSRGRKGGASKN